jgi:2-polyprenyl-3-methyl-5-hydroxy-6-metoxy-1,4-benzoquinol methylase
MPKPRRKVALRRFDTTQCRERQYQDIVHRDYLAHCLRWSWSARFIKPGQRVLDVGCGQDAPLAKVLAGQSSTFYRDKASEYVGVDMNKNVKCARPRWCTIHEEFDFTSRYGELGLFDVITNFEVIEHMGVEDGARLLRAMRDCLKPDGRVILSTPVLDPVVGQAANHIHEFLIPELQSLVESCGLEVVKRYGTFASYNPLKKALAPEHLAVYEALREFHGDGVMACFLSPLYPDAARNNVWLLRRRE